MSIGCVITTFNSQEYFETLWNSIPFHRIDELVVVNGGKPYTKPFTSDKCNVTWIQHESNQGVARSRNDGLKYLREKNCDYYFIIEDDMIILDENIFSRYIDASQVTGLQYFCFVSYPWEAGHRFERTPRLKVQYNDATLIHFYKNSCNEFTFRTKEMLDKSGFYDETYLSCFDVDNYYSITQLPEGHVFWYSPDLASSDDLIMNNTEAVSRMDNDGKRVERLLPDYSYFLRKQGILIQQIPDIGKEKVIKKLKRIKP